MRPRKVYGAMLPIAHLVGLRWLSAWRTGEISRLMTPAIKMAMDSTTEVTLTANPVWLKRVLNIIPMLSPQFTMQKQLKKTTKKMVTVRGKPPARTVRTAKTRLATISKGISRSVYCKKNDSTELAPSSFSR